MAGLVLLEKLATAQAGYQHLVLVQRAIRGEELAGEEPVAFRGENLGGIAFGLADIHQVPGAEADEATEHFVRR
jgi:hypothetical protein